MAQAIDPVCDMTVDTETAQYTSEFEGTTYYFCSPGCKRAFDRNPAEYAHKGQQDAGSTGQGHGTHH